MKIDGLKFGEILNVDLNGSLLSSIPDTCPEVQGLYGDLNMPVPYDEDGQRGHEQVRLVEPVALRKNAKEPRSCQVEVESTSDFVRKSSLFPSGGCPRSGHCSRRELLEVEAGSSGHAGDP